MHYWWVNQGKTHRQEIGGGYMWSPKRNANESRNQFYENMRIVAPGDHVFCYWDDRIRAEGVLQSFGYDAPKPEEFGDAGRNWSRIGFRADVDYRRLSIPLRPRDEWLRIQPLLPPKYSPLHQETGKGQMNLYLAAVPNALGTLLSELIAGLGNRLHVSDARTIPTSMELVERDRWERHEVARLSELPIGDTERDALIRARRGQGRFRQKVALVEQSCRVTRVSNQAYLIASHIKPWRHAENDERLDRDNGLMLAPHADFLFDRGFISFGDGRVVVSDVADPKSLLRLGIDPERPPEVGGFNDRQEMFLEFHRREIFRKVAR